ncbi:MAG: pyridoxamine 5'-phosphate oxidase family protein [Myxococcaceae bacterium]|nr:pyridoxamine 5'-phosphate oxidase family protein [Myxococcaceae bacterium]MCA3015154.1 pyridoxamine 5'-phosphate oxidase family protein [Myxococcaceae bacterium]
MSKAADAARALLAAAHQGALATLGDDGTPLSTFVALADDGLGRPLLLLSGLSEHTRNLRARPRASVLVWADEAGAGGPMDRARVTLSGTVTFLEGDVGGRARARFVAVNPDAARYAALPDFSPARLEPDVVRFVGGFARAGSIELDEYLGGAPAPSPTS